MASIFQVDHLSEEKKSESFSEEKKDERKIWEEMEPLAWHYAVCKNSVFDDTYKITRSQVEDAVKSENYDVILECGSGTGDIIGNLDVSIDRIGIDINELFIEYSRAHKKHPKMNFELLDILNLEEWWQTNGFDKKYKKPLVICVNNTLNIMPENIRGKVINQMLGVVGNEGNCMISYWNGNFFSHAIMNFYLRNPDLCGHFNLDHVNWDDRILECPSGYSTHWMVPEEVQRLLRSYDVNIPTIEKYDRKNVKSHLNTEGLAIFAWFKKDCSSGGKKYYDSNDAQNFYSKIWGESELHIGRYDLLTEEENKLLPNIEKISRAEEIHEMNFIKLIKSKLVNSEYSTKIRILDMGCGYGGLLRRLHKEGLVWHAYGCDYSHSMCYSARELNSKLGASNQIDILEESYLDVSIANESVDLVISMEALLHVGQKGQKIAIEEAKRVLRPGGFMIFSDIMEKDEACPEEMKPIYERIHLSKMGTRKNYEECLANAGFTKLEYIPFSSNIGIHYNTIREVLLERKEDIGISQAFVTKMADGLKVWSDLAPKNLEWGFISAQKTKKI